ncbi:MAG TPA: putative peptidoglycan glycosyltransferase FtsW [Kiloniellaceae bacterium]|nr:putative peptidoglycan glycosyltransferase FtsW [Kiloniellaceae bacterium]
MSSFTRADTSVIGRWWWTVDRWTLVAIVLLMGFGAVLMLAASPAAGGRIGLDAFQLANRQLLLLPFAAVLVFVLSLASPKFVRRFSVIGLLVFTFLLMLTLVLGHEIKGASRWISLFGVSLQPSEFIKPFFAVSIAWLFNAEKENEDIPGSRIVAGYWALLVTLLLLQPDVGQAFLVTAIWGAEFFLAGLSLLWVSGLIGGAVLGLVAAYFLLPHVTARIDSFFDPTAGDHYQIGRSIEAFMNGGLYGRGPGEGTVKAQLPDAHSDFIFAVAGEELGLIACLMILGLFCFVVLRGFSRLLGENSLFVLLAVAGLLVQFGLQALINMASALHLMPTKGMTLPFISYGGSSLVALAIGIGMVLALTRRRVGREGMV